MTLTKQELRRLTRPREAKHPYTVGYCNPPKHSQFRKGQSGNPNGRPKGRKSKVEILKGTLDKNILAEAQRLISLNDTNGGSEMTMQAAVMRSIFASAAKGKPSAQRLVTDLIDKAEQRRAEQIKDDLQFAIHLKEKNELKIKEAEAAGKFEEADAVLPRPAHIQIDPYTAEVTFTGPVTPEDKGLWDQCWQVINSTKQILPFLQEQQCINPEDEHLVHQVSRIKFDLFAAMLFLEKRGKHKPSTLYEDEGILHEFEIWKSDVK